jgi:hypothetical protein
VGIRSWPVGSLPLDLGVEITSVVVDADPADFDREFYQGIWRVPLTLCSFATPSLSRRRPLPLLRHPSATPLLPRSRSSCTRTFMPSPSFLTKAFAAGHLFGHLFIPAERSWVFKLVGSPALDVTVPGLSHRSSVKVGNESFRAQEQQQILTNELHVSLLPSPGNLSVSSNLLTGSQFTPTRPSSAQPILSPGASVLVLPHNLKVTPRPSATQTTISTALRYVYGSSALARPQILVEMPRHHPTRPGSLLTISSLLCVSVLLYHITLLMHRKWGVEAQNAKPPRRSSVDDHCKPTR